MDLGGCQGWLDAYSRAWEQRDPEAAAQLFSEDAVYQVGPFDEPMKGRDAVRAYWARSTGAQEHIRCGCEVLAVSDESCVARWRSSFVRNPTGIKVRLDGIFLLTFAIDGLCDSLLEWWHSEEEPLP